MIHGIFSPIFSKFTLDKTSTMVYNVWEHKMLFYLIPYGD